MAMHEEGVSFTALSEEFGVARQVLSRWGARYAINDVAGLAPLSRRPHASPARLSRHLEQRICTSNEALECGADWP
jgi:hypothetical protein